MSSFISQLYVLAAKESTKVIGRLESQDEREEGAQGLVWIL